MKKWEKMTDKFLIYDFVFAALAGHRVFFVNGKLKIIPMAVDRIEILGLGEANILVTPPRGHGGRIILPFKYGYPRYFKTKKRAVEYAKKKLDKKIRTFWENALPTA